MEDCVNWMLAELMIIENCVNRKLAERMIIEDCAGIGAFAPILSVIMQEILRIK